MEFGNANIDINRGKNNCIFAASYYRLLTKLIKINNNEG